MRNFVLIAVVRVLGIADEVYNSLDHAHDGSSPPYQRLSINEGFRSDRGMADEVFSSLDNACDQVSPLTKGGNFAARFINFRTEIERELFSLESRRSPKKEPERNRRG